MKNKLTETELELMNILWDLGEGSVHDVLNQLIPERDLAYTTVSTILRILEKKSYLDTRKEGRTHIYIPSISKNDYQSHSLDSLLHNVFDNTLEYLVKTLVKSEFIDINELSSLLKKIKKEESEKC